ncbi:hypothetical protein BV924_13695 [Pectobacterium odoriferum]|uniref:DUF1240 domain-containing protein n=1 Tax=Pectobacterium odoriferum TaxID=78398 RepID=A0ABD6VNU4_9GAMM|nr:hypothetical protein [Pectobacterium odoriferum]POD94284.1 hypothetical protein BVY06_15145 [Pectobacterium odoriferum]POE11882.1 hypothetical protein BV924_13695 [Pectobacterium odoriferum]POE25901.1 hypothetical protein BV926_14505 [Pectobacterium odoriferum]POE30212.1 hypothetical protein BV919_13720 [Pectobacterium odoriferum]POE39335.1 hypothetical protein BV920_13440 [Pectobacterium odoriferum]
MYPFKQRVIAFFGVVFLLVVSIGISYLGIFKLREYLSYPDVVNFSFWVVFVAAFFFFFSPLLSMIFSVIFTGKQIAVTSGEKLLKTMFIILGLTVLGMFIFSERYTTSLMDKGYTECLGNPAGWMPSMAKKYAIEPSLCTQQ